MEIPKTICPLDLQTLTVCRSYKRVMNGSVVCRCTYCNVKTRSRRLWDSVDDKARSICMCPRVGGLCFGATCPSFHYLRNALNDCNIISGTVEDMDVGCNLTDQKTNKSWDVMTEPRCSFTIKMLLWSRRHRSSGNLHSVLSVSFYFTPSHRCLRSERMQEIKKQHLTPVNEKHCNSERVRNTLKEQFLLWNVIETNGTCRGWSKKPVWW